LNAHPKSGAKAAIAGGRIRAMSGREQLQQTFDNGIG
jgi:hypothetical protein